MSNQIKNDTLYIACAGAGKTTFLINESLKIDKNKKILITTYTNENTNSIKEKFYKINGFIPENIVIQPWYTFLLRECFKPYFKTAGFSRQSIEGIILINNQSGKYKKKQDLKHYMKDNNVFSDKLSKLMFINDNVKNKVINRLSKMYDYIFIDEVQDLASWDLELIKEIHKSNINLLMVGDMLQRTYTTTKETKNKKYGDWMNIHQYITDNKNKVQSIKINDTTLTKTHRCQKNICDYVNSKFSIKIEPCDCVKCEKDINAEIKFISLRKINELELSKEKIMQLLYDKNSKYSEKYNTINIGKSKGLEWKNVIIYPTDTMISFLKENKVLKDKSKSQLYVALTRANINVYIHDKSLDTDQNTLF